MYARSRTLDIAREGLSSPLLVPSVSSKGFPIVDGVSEASRAAAFVSQDLSEAMLISAYDLRHGLLLDGGRLLGGDHFASTYGTPKLLVIDSGGYEIGGDFESGEVNRSARETLPFSPDDYVELLGKLPENRDILAVSYDYSADERGTYDEQRGRAQDLFARFPHLKSDFLLKPEPSARYIDPSRLVPHARDLRAFDVIGVTEKELGVSLLERLKTLAQIRVVLDDAAVTAPIHVFGALDPLISPMYFMVGGEIFDGLSWIRYAYWNGVAVHQDAPAVLLGNVDDDPTRRDMRRHMSNLAELGKLKHCLERWVSNPDRFDLLGEHHNELREIFETVLAQLERKG